MTVSLDEKLFAMGTDRERLALWDIEKRETHVASILLKSVRLSEPWRGRTCDRSFQLPPSSSWSYHTDIMGRDIPLPVPPPVPSTTCSGLQQMSSHLSRIKFEDSAVGISSASPSEPFIEGTCNSLKGDGDEMEGHVTEDAPVLPPDTDQLTATIANASTAAAAALLNGVIDDCSFLVAQSVPRTSAERATATRTGTQTHWFQPLDCSHFVEERSSTDEAGIAKLRVVFDGLKRAMCEFGIKMSADPESFQLIGNEGEEMRQLSGGADGALQWLNNGDVEKERMEENDRPVRSENEGLKSINRISSQVIYIDRKKDREKDKNDIGEHELESGSWIARHLIGPETLDPDSKECSDLKEQRIACRVSVEKYELVEEGKAIVLSDKVCVSSYSIDMQLTVHALTIVHTSTLENNFSCPCCCCSC